MSESDDSPDSLRKTRRNGSVYQPNSWPVDQPNLSEAGKGEIGHLYSNCRGYLRAIARRCPRPSRRVKGRVIRLRI